ncbi:hypothetical protein SEUCBS139899_008207 [Sporothrix eucalyptigena]
MTANEPTTSSSKGVKVAKDTTPQAPQEAGHVLKNNRNSSTSAAGRKHKKTTKSTVRTSPNNTAAQASQTQLKLWRETLDVLTKLEKVQGRLAEQAAIATGEASEAMADSSAAPAEKPENDATGSAGKPLESKKKSKPVYTEEQKKAALKSAKEAQEQVKKLTSALHLLKKVLSTQGSQKQPPETTSKGAQADEADQSECKPLTESSTATDPPGPVSKKPPSKKRTALVDVPLGSAAIGAVQSRASGVPPGKAKFRVNKIESHDLMLQPVEENIRPVPRLHYDLDRALFNPGVYHLQDPRSRVFNFDPYLATIMPLQEFDFNALKQYVTSSKDSTLISMAHKYKMKYSGSTSSMTSLLSHFHFLLSSWRPINVAHTTRSFAPESLNFTRIMRGPAATFLHYKDGTYAIDADKEFDSANILSMLGKSMEKLLTLSKEDFEKYRVTRSHELTEEERNDPESFHYTTFGDFMMRSQLDAHDPRLPGTGMFDLKTRAVVSIRMDARDFHRGLGYEIRNRFGQWESFEREYYDMIRSAFLKYSLQVRMGRMDGIYVAFHNTERIFGFQYISINEMDLALHGTEDTTLGDREFMLSLRLLNEVLDRATQRFPGRSLRLHVETRPSDSAPFMYVFAKPVTADEIAEVQDASKESVEEFERNILGMTADGKRNNSESEDLADAAADNTDVDFNENENRNETGDVDYEEDSEAVWETMRQRVEEAMENEAQGIETVRDAIEDALEQSGLLRGRSPEETRVYVDALLGAITRTDTEVVAETILKGQEDTTAEEQAEAETEVEAESEEITGSESPAEAKNVESEPTTTETSEATLSSDIEGSSLADDPSKSIIDEDGDNYVVDSEASDKNEVVESPSQSSSSSASSPGTLSLKDLIIKLAAQVEAAESRNDTGSTATTTTGTIEGSAEEQPADAEKTADNATSSETSVAFNYSDSIAELEDAPKNKRFERILSVLMASSKEGKSTIKDTVTSSSSTTSPATASTSSSPSSPSSPIKPLSPFAGDHDAEILGMIVTVRNQVNGRYVARPNELRSSDKWTVQYAIEEIQDRRAQALYDMLKKRRKTLLRRDPEGTDEDGGGNSGDSGPRGRNSGRKDAFNRNFMEKLYKMSAQGRRFRSREDSVMSKKPVHVYGAKEGLPWETVFGNGGSENRDGKKIGQEE